MDNLFVYKKVKRKKIIQYYTMFLLFCSGILSAQVKLEGQFFEYATFYISNIDVSTGQSDVPLFRYRISSDTYPIYAKVWFKASVLSPALGIESRTTLTEIESRPFQMKADIVLDNRNFSTNSISLLDEGSPPNSIPILVTTKEFLNASEFDQLASALMTTGKLADGEYRFEIKVFSGSSKFDLSLSDQDMNTIIVESPTGINLESPGGIIADTSFNMVYTKNPVFNWNKGYCLNCETYIRVAEFKPEVHSSIEDAINDERTLPFDQSQSWMKLEDVSSYQYPISGARSLEYGKIYLWQIKTKVPTTNGMEDQPSPIYAFKLSNPSELGTSKIESTVIQKLRRALGDERYNAIFGPDGELEGFGQMGKASLNDSEIDESTLQKILDQIIKQELSIKSVETEN